MMPNLTARDRHVLIWGGIIAVCCLTVQFLLLPQIEYRDRMKQQMAAQAAALEQMYRLGNEYREIIGKQRLSGVSAGAGFEGFTLFSYIDGHAAANRIKNRIDYMKPHQTELDDPGYTLSGVKLKLKGVYYDDLIRFLSGVEAPEAGIWIDTLFLSRTEKQQKVLDAVIEIQALIREAGERERKKERPDS